VKITIRIIEYQNIIRRYMMMMMQQEVSFSLCKGIIINLAFNCPTS